MEKNSKKKALKKGSFRTSKVYISSISNIEDLNCTREQQKCVIDIEKFHKQLKLF